MTASRTLALMMAPRVDAGVEEFVRLCVGLVAGGGVLEIVEAGGGAGVLTAGKALPPEVERSLGVLAEVGVVPRTVTGAELIDLLRDAHGVLRIADPSRAGTPRVLGLDDAYLETADPEQLLEAVAAAGQVVLDL